MSDQGDGSREPDAAGDAVDDAVMGLLHDHVPLTLLVDLVDAPPSEQVLAEEGIPEQRWWEGSGRPADAAAPPSDR